MFSRWVFLAGLAALAVLAFGTHAADPTEADTAGALNRLSPAAVVAAADLIRSGKVYSLAIPTGPDTPAWKGRTYQMLTDRIFLGDKHTLGKNKLQGFDDYACAWLGIGTQIDGFAHVAVDGHHYGGLPSNEVIRPRGARRFGIENVRPIVGRGVLLDLTLMSNGAPVAAGTAINRADIEAVAAAQNVTINAGDIVLLHTGWLATAATDPGHFMETEPGLGLDGARYLASLEVAAIGADNHSLEVYPAEHDGDFLPVHGYLLADQGIHVLENIATAELAADRAYTFFFVLAAPRLVGAVQAPVHPVAIR